MTQDPKPLNDTEVWVAEHSAPIFVVLVVLILLGAGAVFWTFQKSGNAQEQVRVLRPQVTRINRAICDRRSLEDKLRAHRCAERTRVGLVNCRDYRPCRDALLAAIAGPLSRPGATASPGSPSDTGGGVAQNPSNPGQQPGPGHQPGHPGHKPPKSSPSPVPAPTPAPAPAPAAPTLPNGKPFPGVGPPGGPPGLKACAAVVCVEAEVDLNPKGLLP